MVLSVDVDFILDSVCKQGAKDVGFVSGQGISRLVVADRRIFA